MKYIIFILVLLLLSINIRAEISMADDCHVVNLSRSSIKQAMTYREGLRRLEVVPIFEEGKIVHYIMKNINKSSLFDMLQLNKGDILLSYDGKSLKSVTDVLDFYKHLRYSPEVMLKIKRGINIICMKYIIQPPEFNSDTLK